MDHHQYTATQWRKRLEQRGWISFRRGAPPGHVLIEYHIIYRGHLYSGRCKMNEIADQETWTVGSTGYLLRRVDLTTEGVWRRARNQAGKAGRVCRPWH